MVPGNSHAISQRVVAGRVGVVAPGPVVDADLPIVANSRIGLENLLLEVDQLNVVVFVEDMVHGGQPEVLVGTAVARDVVVPHRFQQQLVGDRVIGSARIGKD
ncbi:hypothetical protein D9M70_651950 [compost metagenome]